MGETVMKRILRCGVVIGLLCAMAGSASALSIPDYVDFHAEQTEPQTLYPGDGGWVNEWVVLKNIYAFDDPVWVDDSWLTIDNQYDETREKHLWLLIDFVGDELPLPFVPNIITSATVSDPVITVDDYEHVVMWEWVLAPQPDWEDIGFVDIELTEVFPVATFDFDSDAFDEIDRIEIATYCVPEPCTLLVCGIGLALLGIRRRR